MLFFFFKCVFRHQNKHVKNTKIPLLLEWDFEKEIKIPICLFFSFFLFSIRWFYYSIRVLSWRLSRKHFHYFKFRRETLGSRVQPGASWELGKTISLGSLVKGWSANKQLFITNYCLMHQINNMQQVRFIRSAEHVYYFYLRYSAVHIWSKTLLLYRWCFAAEYVRLTVWSALFFAWFMDTIKSYLLGWCK